MNRSLIALTFVLFPGCMATTSHRLDAASTLTALGSDGYLTVVTKRGDTLNFQAPFVGHVGQGDVEVESPLLPRARFDADDVVAVETTMPSAAKTGLLVGGTMLGLTGLLAGGIALSVSASAYRPILVERPFGGTHSPLGS